MHVRSLAFADAANVAHFLVLTLIVISVRCRVGSFLRGVPLYILCIWRLQNRGWEVER